MLGKKGKETREDKIPHKKCAPSVASDFCPYKSFPLQEILPKIMYLLEWIIELLTGRTSREASHKMAYLDPSKLTRTKNLRLFSLTHTNTHVPARASTQSRTYAPTRTDKHHLNLRENHTSWSLFFCRSTIARFLSASNSIRSAAVNSGEQSPTRAQPGARCFVRTKIPLGIK